MSSRRFDCRACGDPAGVIELLGPATRAELRREAFTSVMTQPLSPAGFATLSGLLTAAGAARELFAWDPELVPFYCPGCDASYCSAHMRHWDVFGDDGLHDSIRGCCPEGHERMLED